MESHEEPKELAKHESDDAIFFSIMMETGDRLMDKYADAQKFVATEQTKRSGLFLDALNTWKLPLTILSVMFIAILGYSVYQGNYDFPEKIITFLVGTAVGALGMKASSKPQN